MKVVWDGRKAAGNIQKHGIWFSDAATVLDDPLAITVEDMSHNEQRFASVGSDLMGRVLVIVFLSG